MSNSHSKPAAIAVSAALAGGIALSGSAFAMQPLSQGYLLSAQDAATPKTEPKAQATDAKKAEGSCGAHKGKTEGSCGADKMKAQGADAGRKTEADADSKGHMEGKCGEGKCGGAA